MEHTLTILFILQGSSAYFRKGNILLCSIVCVKVKETLKEYFWKFLLPEWKSLTASSGLTDVNDVSKDSYWFWFVRNWMCLYLGRLKRELLISEARTEELLPAWMFDLPQVLWEGQLCRGAPSAVGHMGRKLVLVWDNGGAGERPCSIPSWVRLVSTNA